MLRFSNDQMSQFKAGAAASNKAEVFEQLLRVFPDLQDEQKVVSNWLDELIADGFDLRDMLWEAASSLIKIGLRADPQAAEDRAVATAVLQNTDNSPEARLKFLRAQKLTIPIVKEDA